MKKILVFICCLALAVCLTACGEKQEAATETTTDSSFNALVFDTKIVTLLSQVDIELDYLYDYMEANKTNLTAVQDQLTTTKNDMTTFRDKIGAVIGDEEDASSKYKATAMMYASEIGMQCTYLSLYLNDVVGISFTDPAFGLDEESIATLQSVLDEGDRIDKVYDWKRQIVDNRKAFLLDCGEFEDEAAVDAYLAEYPYPAEY